MDDECQNELHLEHVNFQSYYDRGNRITGFKVEENYFDATLLFLIND